MHEFKLNVTNATKMLSTRATMWINFNLARFKPPTRRTDPQRARFYDRKLTARATNY